MPDQSRFEEDMTLIQHVGEKDRVMGAVVPPIFQTSLFVFDDLDKFQNLDGAPESDRFVYSRITNPTVSILEQKVAMLERAEGALVFSSGMGAISAAIMSAIKTGAHIVMVDTIYGPTRKFITEYLPRFGITYTAVDGRDTDELLAAIKPETMLVCLESPSSLYFRLQDLKAVANECQKRGITTMIDNTYGLTRQYPIEMGIDLVCHTASKVISGHSDVIAGVVCGSKARMDKIRMGELELFGSIVAPIQAYLLIRGLRTLRLRLDRTQETANKVSAWVKARPEVSEIWHVGDADFEQAALRDRQMTGTACIFSFVPKTNDRAKIKKFVESLSFYRLGVSWGGHESLVVVSPEPQNNRTIIRLCQGLESADDLIADLAQAIGHLA